MESTHDIGDNLLIKTARIVIEGPCYGAYLILMYFFLKIFSRRRLRLKRSIFLAAITILLFLCSTCFFVTDIADLIIRIRILLLDDFDPSFESRMAKADGVTEPLMWTGTVIFIFALSIGDSILVWRTWALYQDQLIYAALPILTLLGSFTSALFELGCLIETHFSTDEVAPNASSVGADQCKQADKASYTLSFVTNIVCTGLIVWKAWCHRRYMNTTLGRQRKQTQVDRVLLLFCESGAIYLVLYILQSIPIYNTSLSPGALVAMNIVNAVIQQAMGMYPTAIVVICQMQKSLWDSFEVPSSSEATTSLFGTGSFAPTTIVLDMDQMGVGRVNRGKGRGRMEFAAPPQLPPLQSQGTVSSATGVSAVCSCSCGGCKSEGRDHEGSTDNLEGLGERKVHLQRKEKKIGEVGFFDVV
ncbi:hypothetical protein E1B28_000089 [Marasmius oreades]|uniref:Uncharacterized protein n=1 Tax=Marasmius oreades TaxID=181124 RepID=A0A9P7V0Q6_9AGAR|nr:uncharacterized protein E1B28_000089 [Marasmius oreades]KAG7098117.1 hypothetical protein E1B28_000089 [Marasmius oreades]